MYHYRIVARPERVESAIPEERLDRYTTYWNSNQQIREYISERAKVTHVVVLFLEYFPYVLSEWFGKNMDKLDKVMTQMKRTLSFLKKEGLRNENLITLPFVVTASAIFWWV